MRFILFIILMMSIGCMGPKGQDQEFVNLANNYVKKILIMNPEWATSLGDHRFDHLLNDYSKTGTAARRQLNQFYLDSLSKIDIQSLSETNRIDYQIMQSKIEAALFRIDVLQEMGWNPRMYNIGGAIYNLLARDFAPLEQRLQNIKQRLQGIPLVLENAKQNLVNPPRIFTETAIQQNEGVINLVGEGISSFFNDLPALKSEFDSVQNEVIGALEEYGEWLRKDLLPRSNGDFRIGSQKYDKKLFYTLESDLSKEQILKRAMSDLIKTQNEMYTTALPLYKRFFAEKADQAHLENKMLVIRNVLDQLAEKRPDNETIVQQARQSLQSCTEFVRHNNIITVPQDPIDIIVMPEFQRGVSVAYCDAPGPLEKNAKTFYAIAPTPRNWSEQRVTSFFKEYNYYMLENLTVHEAMPGHYLQLAHANNFRAPTNIRLIFGSGTFVEGWASYAEQLMVEKGYGGPEVKMQQLKMRLRTIINAIIDQKIHTAAMTEQEAIDMMIQQGFQEEGEAAGKWRRACLTSTQLSTYYVGNIEVNDIRSASEQKLGTAFDLKKFHDKMLSYASIAPKYIKHLLL